MPVLDDAWSDAGVGWDDIDGIAVTTGWEFDAGINSVVFETDYIPAGGATVEIYYMVMPPCDA